MGISTRRRAAHDAIDTAHALLFRCHHSLEMRMCSVSVLSSRERIGEILHITMEATSPLSRARGKKKFIKTQKRCNSGFTQNPELRD